MRNIRFQVASGAIVVAMAVSGCMQTTGGADGTLPSMRGGQAVERDVEAPEVFSKRDRALWDGRPSLGGVWVAHPDVRTPERVIIRNAENGRETIGALFKRERLNPGPVFQVSAEAAAAIGMLAGAPIGIEVVALRTEEIAPEPAPAPAPEAAPEAVAQAAPPEAPAPEPARAATAETPPPAAPPATEMASAAASATPETMIALPEADAPAPRQGFFARLFGRDRSAPSDADVIQTAALDDPAPAADTPAPVAPNAPLPMPTPIGAQASAAPVVAAAAPVASTLDKPFIQLGIFSVEANANRARKLAADAGLAARVVRGQTQGNQFWRVTVGPAQDAAGQRDLLARVKALGFNDAYTVRR